MLSSLPPITLNKSLVNDLLISKTPSISIGLVEVENVEEGFVAIRTSDFIPKAIVDQGVNFGHGLYGNSDIVTVQFVFDFYGSRRFNAVLDANNHVVRTVIKKMMENGNYFFLLINADKTAKVFRSYIDQSSLRGFKENISRIMGSTTTLNQYYMAVQSFKNSSEIDGDFLNWSCRSNVDYLDIQKDPITFGGDSI